MLKERFVNVKFNVNLTHSITRLGDLVISGCCIVNSGSNSLSLSMLLLFVFFVGVLCDDAIYYFVDYNVCCTFVMLFKGSRPCPCIV